MGAAGAGGVCVSGAPVALTGRVPEGTLLVPPRTAWLLLRAVDGHLHRASAVELDRFGELYRALRAELSAVVRPWASAQVTASRGSAEAPGAEAAARSAWPDTNEVAEMLNVTPRRVRQLKDRLGAEHAGSGWRYDPVAVASYLSERREG